MEIHVDANDAGARIDRFLADVPGVGSRSAAEKLVAAGSILVNGTVPAKSHRVKSGDIISVPDSVSDTPTPAPRAQTTLPILYEDDHVLVIDKPAGLVVHPAPGYRDQTMIEMLTADGFELAPSDDTKMYRPGVVHRLDKDTSGVIAFARTPLALRGLQDALRARTARREYTALVHGHVPSRAGRIEAPIGRDSRDASRQSIDTDNPKDAITHFVVTEVLPTTTLLRLRLETGRTHQIRVHLQAIGYPVVGDPAYGDGGETWGLKRQFLHAQRLRFLHPATGKEIEVSAPLPEDLVNALADARRASDTKSA